MIEEIKKEIKKDKYKYWIWRIGYRVDYISVRTVLEILDRHKEDKYKNAWEELKELIDGGNGYEIMQELEQKYNLGE